AGRCDDNRPLVCAYRPAPVQISHYDAATSGLSVMDAVLTDRVMTPRGGSERFCERPMRLPSLYLHAPMTDAPDAGPPPMRVNGYPTFGSVNNPAKVSDEALRLWAKVMKKIPNARLRLKYKNWFESEGLSRRVLGIMSEQGVDHGRVELLGDTDVSIPHLAFYNGIDIALDPFPVNGSTTTFEALWMGVPVVTLLGRSMISRWTASMLTAVDRSEWIARTPEEYVELCARLVADPGRLGAWRRSLRSTVAASPLCDARGKARQLERVYRALWCRWCAGAAERAGAVEAEGGRLVEMGRLEEARLYFERALESKPDDTVLLNNAGSVLTLLGLHGEASALFEKALRLDPGYGKARWNLAASLCGHGNALLPASPGEAEALYRRAVEVLPEFVEGHYNLGVLHGERGRLAEAARCYERALSLQPDHFEAALNLGEVLSRLRRHDEAWRVLAPLPERRPDDAKARVALGNAHLGLGRFDEAVASYERALALSPDCGGALNNLGGVLQILGRFDDAVACYRSALTANPDDVTAHRNLLAAILYNKGWSEDDRFAEHRRFAEAHVRDVPPDDASFADRVDPDRRLRVGYLSSDLRDHSVARNLLPVIEARDPARSEVFFYAEVGAPDAMSGRFRALADGWRSTVGLDDRAVAGMIRADAIDVLVCLAGRFDDNRPLVAAYRPAPVQVSYYDAATSGLGTMDALLTDRVMTPRGGRERFSERPVRLPTFYVHGPMDDAPDVVPPPMRANGYPTFGCFNSPAKLGDDVLLLWAWVLQRVPAAKLRLKYRNMFASSSLAERVRAVMGAQGVSPDRLLLEGGDDDGFSHLSLYGGVDIALDPFPFNGSTTTFESLWMGVPVVTLLGTNLMGRWTASMLTAIGRTDLIARTPEAYVDLCARLCADPDRLGEWRRSMRSTVAASPLCDAGGRGRQVDRVYRALWRKWCARARVIG
ncbi:MAG: tetratricopeptide repeat protein, partial [Alphaproteobacteria bacterium]|nr:tetratricopeptide repeat protein [Alphaproteobacteria bacterium]